jgi:two-component system chemotaxis response regulator CheB
MNQVKVLVVDDSALMRKLLVALLGQDASIDVVGSAIDPFDARDKIKLLQPDVLTLDVEMPGMNGLAFLRNLMRLRPMPVVIVSTVTSKGAAVTLKALELGAFDYIAKPDDISDTALAIFAGRLCEKVKAAKTANIRLVSNTKMPHVNSNEVKQDLLIAIGASTGGTEALRELLEPLMPPFPPIVVTQHIPKQFSSAFAERLNNHCQLTVVETVGGEKIECNHVYIAPGNRHLEVHKSAQGYVCHLLDGPVVNRHKPSVDVLFNSVAEVFGHKSIGVLLTGMGKDGALGLLKLHDSGAFTIAQDEASSVVWGMPGSAVELGGVDLVLALPKIALKLATLVQQQYVTKNSRDKD